jgi:glycosyltransferase involved in cell wall biosynthesis
MPAVSVIMPAYNVARYITTAIESVLTQTFSDWELLIVDDGSTDNTLEIATAYAHRDSRLVVIQQANSGISAARNRALANASGSLIAVLDSDDVWLPEFLEKQVRILEDHPDVDIVTGNAWFLGSARDGQLARPYPDRRPHPDLVNLLADEESVFIMAVFRRRVYETIGGFDEALRTNEDYDYWLRAAGAGFRFRRNDEPLGRYRRRDDSLSASELRMLRGVLRVYRKLRPSLLGRPGELAVIDAQIARFDTERVAAEARDAMDARDFVRARSCLRDLYSRRGGARLRVASLMARWTPSLLVKAYTARRARLLAHAAPSPRGAA